jgi:hypothetical protein
MAVALWQGSLGSRNDDVHVAARDRLRQNYEVCRNLSMLLAGEIVRDNPNFTVHDVTHMDALWELADLIAGSEYSLTPTEGFVLGCAMLIHDLAMSMAAFPGNEATIIGTERWRDAVYTHLQQELNRRPTRAEIEGAPSHILEAAKREMLRTLHAEQAERLTHEQFQDRANDSTYFLIQDTDLRNIYSDIIGRVAASHAWDHKRLADEFDAILGAPASFPREWIVDPLKLACLLRTADASHLDGRRAPGFLRAVRAIDDGSRPYWVFQERLNRPWLDGDRLVFTASQPFAADDSEAWWMCIDALRVVNRELGMVDALLADTGHQRFTARSVAYIDDLERLARFIPVRDWFPVDARIQVGDVIDLVRKLGGEKLYGNDPISALRELISNASDALRARRVIGNPHENSELRFRVAVQIKFQEGQNWLTVRDNGIGMTREVMSGPLLDFGKSYWSSSPARDDFPGLISSGFSPTGEFGIGFFSVFMLGDHVKVASRRFDLAASDTHVLVFKDGLGSRPLLRRAVSSEFLPYGGTEVTVELNEKAAEKLLTRGLEELCSWLCPTADVNIDVQSDDGQVTAAVSADDWMTCSPGALIGRLGESKRSSAKELLDRVRPVGRPGEPIKGRAAILATSIYRSSGNERSVISVGGMRSSTVMTHLTGVFLGRTLTAARDAAVPLADTDEIQEWATEQARLISALEIDPEVQMEISSVICALRGGTEDLIIGLANCGYMNLTQIQDWGKDKDLVYVWDESGFRLSDFPENSLAENVLVTNTGWPGIYQQRYQGARFPGAFIPEHFASGYDNSLEGRCGKAIFRGWGLPESEAIEQIASRMRVVQAYENARSEDYSEEYEYHDSTEDVHYPFREEVAREQTGQPFFTSVTPLARRASGHSGDE